MKLIDGQIEFEQVTCDFCDGKKERTQGILYPNMHKAVGVGKKCSCGAKNKRSNTLIGEKIVPCDFCDATGVVMETMYDYLPKEIFVTLPVTVYVNKPRRFVGEDLFGLGLVGGATDYGRMKEFHATNGDAAAIEIIRGEYSNRQVIGFMLNKQKFATGLDLVIRGNDYSVYPTWN